MSICSGAGLVSNFIRREVESLPEKQRVAVLLHKYEEMDYTEIAKVLDCSESALKSLLFRAYESLRVQLAPLVGPAVRDAESLGRKAAMKCEDVSKELIGYLDRRANSAERDGRWKNTWFNVRPAVPAPKNSAISWSVLEEVPA